MNPYEKDRQKQIEHFKTEIFEIKQELDDLNFYRIMWKGLFVVSAALNFAWWVIL